MVASQSVQSLSRVRLFATPWTAAHWASLSITKSWCSNSCPSSQWCQSSISSSVVTFSCCLQSFPASGSFLIIQRFASGRQSIGASASTSVPISLGWWLLFSQVSWGSLRKCWFSSLPLEKAQNRFVYSVKSQWPHFLLFTGRSCKDKANTVQLTTRPTSWCEQNLL